MTDRQIVKTKFNTYYVDLTRKESIKKANYTYVKYLGDKQHLLKDNNTGQLEAWFSNKNHTSYGIIYKNTHLEFAHSCEI